MHPSECIAAAVLPTGALTLEFQPCEDAIGTDRREVERRIHEMYTGDHNRAFLALGLIARSLRLSPSLEYWRDLASSFVHEALVDPRVEETRGDAGIVMNAEEAAAWSARVPAMVGAEFVDASFIVDAW